jgi:putative FmdB family regulatory protein
MPIYEFVCESCGRQSSVFQRRITAEVRPSCPNCQSASMRRLISRFSVVRSTRDAFDDSALDGLDENDPEAMARWAGQMGGEMGDGGFGGGLDDLGLDDGLDGGLDGGFGC